MSLDHLIKRWNLKSGDELLPPEGYTTQITMVVAADGKHLILSDHEGQVDFWDLATGQRTQQIQPPHLGGINWLAQSSDGKWLAGGTSQDVRLFDLSTGKAVRDMYLGDNSDAKWSDTVKIRVAFAPGGKVLLSTSSKTPGVTAWDVQSGKRLWNTPGADPIIACDPSGRWIACGGNYGDQPIKWTFLDAITGKIVANRHHNSGVSQGTWRLPVSALCDRHRVCSGWLTNDHSTC